MDLDPLSLVRAALPKVPMIGRTVLSHTLGVSPTSQKWDLRTEVTVNVLRSFVCAKPSSISKTQYLTCKDPGVKGKIWVARTKAQPPPEDSLRDALFQTIDEMNISGAPLDYLRPDYIPVEAEWTGYRSGATKGSTELRIPEEEKYAELMREATAPTTILYLHGGAYYLMDPSTHRSTCQTLAKITKGRCYSVRYRLAPQAAFPSQLLDALHSYFTLLYPPPGAVHTPVRPEHIVLAGDSAGGNLSVVLMQTLMHFKRTSKTIHLFGHSVDMSTVSLPAGLALSSPWLDLTHSSPSCDANSQWDYLPGRSSVPDGLQYPEDSIWPPKPPALMRKTLYADDALLMHPLVSPLALSVKAWEGTPPTFMCFGDELLQDECRWVASQIARSGSQMVVEEFEAMPHCFAQVFEGTEIARTCYEGWAGFIKRCVEEPDAIKTEGKRILTKGLKVEARDVKELNGDGWTEEIVLERMKFGWAEVIKQPGQSGKAMDGAKTGGRQKL